MGGRGGVGHATDDKLYDSGVGSHARLDFRRETRSEIRQILNDKKKKITEYHRYAFDNCLIIVVGVIIMIATVV